ncbi:Pfs, NACHT and ankyrin domain protein [Aaosphaeria arxii CBS 175.79]|uniref:Pfs, NACHT and ankyrin domain protein n=1 Tax=Aaosphaeria arxii CBS 175.79 TaxID=1450172 RepID=A0A6A5Y9G2_9PLEO|nr:Pfs, NACHT and ankyrin domain protein [Aaosphaeria arxii CBS 175.79]KAF2022235.1 Pfs, NACHT and ankyrin domain protein [Aaosphaeria arxii CBS 175.79]
MNLTSILPANASLSYAGKLTSARVNVLGHGYYFIQDRESIEALWRTQMLSSPMASYIITLKYLFGMRENALLAYQEDNSGPFPKPFPGSNVEARNRIDKITHQVLLRGFTGSGLKPLTQRTAGALRKRLDQLPVDQDWVEYPDLLKFFYDIVGTSIVESLAGPSHLQINPTFLDDFWTFDQYIPWFARGMPSFLIPKGSTVRSKLINQLQSWYSFARNNFHESSIGEDGDFDSYWGSSIIRSRHETLRHVDGHDDSAHASTDLGLLWASLSNVVPAAMFATLHIFKEHGLLGRVRDTICDKDPLGVNRYEITKDPLLQSIYMETLRVYVKTYFLTTSPIKDINVGKWHIPKDGLILVNSGISHMDKDFWNSKAGQWPVETFWADRFIKYPGEENSGPALPEIAKEEAKTCKIRSPVVEKCPYISTDGLEGSWIPFGGGHAMCPGRFLAKNAIIAMSAAMASMFDMEIMTDSVDTSSGKFGLGTSSPKKAVPFRLRRRHATL